MSEELRQNLKDYSYEAYEAIPLTTTVPPMAHNVTSLPRDYAVSNAQEISHLGQALTDGDCSRSPLRWMYPRTVFSRFHKRLTRPIARRAVSITHHSMGNQHP